MAFRRKWFKDHPAPYYCFYCQIEHGEQSTQELPTSEVTLDHYHPRGSHPTLAYEVSNIRVSCGFHNYDKGSIDGDKYVKLIRSRGGMTGLRFL